MLIYSIGTSKETKRLTMLLFVRKSEGFCSTLILICLLLHFLHMGESVRALGHEKEALEEKRDKENEN